MTQNGHGVIPIDHKPAGCGQRPPAARVGCTVGRPVSAGATTGERNRVTTDDFAADDAALAAAVNGIG